MQVRRCVSVLLNAGTHTRTDDDIVNKTGSMGKLSTALNGCRKKIWPEADNDSQGHPKQQDEIKHILVFTCKVPGE